MRIVLAKIFLTPSVMFWGTWFGGQLFNALNVIPKWLSSPPDSLRVYDEIPSEAGLNFFLLNPFFFLFSLFGMLFAWNTARKARKWLLITTFLALAISLVLIFYLAPLIGKTSAHAIEGDIAAKEVRKMVEEWKLGNKIRLGFECVGFLFSIISLTVWSAESQVAKEMKMTFR